MKTRRILTVALVAVLLAGCGGANHVEEKTLLTTVTAAMEALTSAIDEADAPPAVAAALIAFTDEVEPLVPAMKKLNEEHPEWETDPPRELEVTLAKFNDASQGFQTVMPKLMRMAGDNPADPRLQEALNRFQELVSGL